MNKNFKQLLFFLTVSSLYSFQPQTTAELQTAVDLWIDDNASAQSTYGEINTWDVSLITNMSNLFLNKTSFNDDVGNWDVSSVTTMSQMFRNAKSFNQDLSTWDVSNVTSMNALFASSDNPGFNGDISTWDVSNVTNMAEMFRYATNFNQDITDWNVYNVTTMSLMFDQAHDFNQDISSWDVSSVGNMCNMFMNAYSFNQDISDWNVSSVTNFCTIFQNTPLSEDNQCAIHTSFSSNDAWPYDWSGFCGPTPITQDNIHEAVALWVDDQASAEETYGHISDWDVSNVTDMHNMFNMAGSFNEDISGWDVSSVTSMGNMFNASGFNSDISGWDVSNVTSVHNMFRDSPFNQDISNWDVSQVTDMQRTFYNTPFDQDISEWDVSSATDMVGMFDGANSLSDLNKCFIHTSFSSNENWDYDWSEQCTQVGYTHVPDDNFEQALIDLGYDDELDDFVHAEDVSEVTFLELIEKGITDLTGIEAFDALTFLNVAVNQLESIDVSSNLNLNRLDAGGNTGLTQLEFAENGNMTSVNLNATGFEFFDFSTHTPNLEHLDWCCSENLTYLDFEGLENLRWANISSNSLEYLGLGGNEALENLYVNNNNLDSLNLRDAVNLRSFECPNNQLTYLKMSTEALEGFNATENLLTCIETPDPEYATENWTYENGNIDEGVSFSDDCAYGLLGFISLTPGADPLLMPEDGGTFMYVVEGYHYLETYEEYEALLYVDLPNGERHGPVGGTPVYLEVDAGFSFIRVLEQRVPAAAPAGEYNFYCLLKSGEEVVDSSGFIFTKLNNNPHIIDPLVSFDHSEWPSYYADNGFQVISANDIWAGNKLYRADGTPINEMGTLGLDEANLPTQFSLHQNYPNPFNPATTLRYDLPENSFVRITIYDMLGNDVSNLLNRNENSGYKSIQWNATNNQGQPVSAGVYLYSIEAGDFRQTKKMVLLK